jgi:hypothetical protein
LPIRASTSDRVPDREPINVVLSTVVLTSTAVVPSESVGGSADVSFRVELLVFENVQVDDDLDTFTP